jgi:hypothetical protein
VRFVGDGRGDGTCDEADDDEDGAADSRFVLGVAVWVQDLVEERGEGVEEARVDAKGEEDEVEGGCAEHCSDGGGDGGFAYGG